MNDDTARPIAQPEVLMSKRAQHIALTGAALTFAAGVGFVAVDWDRGGREPLFLVGLVVAVIGTMCVVGTLLWRALSARIRAIDDVFDRGRMLGHRTGYAEGRREGRPVVVLLNCPECGADLHAEKRAKVTA